MNTSDWVTLITAITAFVGAVSGLVIAIRHILNHDPITPDKPPAPPQNSPTNGTTNVGKTTL